MAERGCCGKAELRSIERTLLAWRPRSSLTGMHSIRAPSGTLRRPWSRNSNRGVNRDYWGSRSREFEKRFATALRKRGRRMSFYDLSLHLVPTDEDVRPTGASQLPKLERDVIDMTL